MAMNSYWEENPPIHLMIKAYMGLNNESKKLDSKDNEKGLQEIMSSPNIPKDDNNNTNRPRVRMI